MASCQVFSEEEIASFRKGGKILRACLEEVAGRAKAGVTTLELDRIAEAFIRDHGGEPAFKGYHGFPATLCTSINEECVHGIPGKRVVQDGDIVSLDCGVLLDDLYTDACVSVGVGEVTPDAQRLLSVTEGALEEALRLVRAGVKVGTISAAIERMVNAGGCQPLEALTGHGLGRALHQYPDVPNIGSPNTGAKLPAGTVIAIEPIVSLSTRVIRQLDDGWTIVTADHSLSAHFEHSVLVTEGGCEVIA